MDINTLYKGWFISYDSWPCIVEKHMYIWDFLDQNFTLITHHTQSSEVHMTTSQYNWMAKTFYSTTLSLKSPWFCHGEYSEYQCTELVRRHVLKSPEARDFFFKFWEISLIPKVDIFYGQFWILLQLDCCILWSKSGYNDANETHHWTCTESNSNSRIQSNPQRETKTSDNDGQNSAQSTLKPVCRRWNVKKSRKNISIDERVFMKENILKCSWTGQSNVWMCTNHCKNVWSITTIYFRWSLLPDLQHGPMMILEWMFDLETEFGSRMVATKFTAVNQAAHRAVASFRQAIERNNFECIALEMDQVRRCKRICMPKYYKITSNIQILEEEYGTAP